MTCQRFYLTIKKQTCKNPDLSPDTPSDFNIPGIKTMDARMQPKQ